MDTLAAAQLLTCDHQAGTRRLVCSGLALLLAWAAVPQPASALPWLDCNAVGLSRPVAQLQTPPDYPESARQAGAEGFVEVSFVVLRDGRVGWARVVKAEPSGFFEGAALAAVRDWRYLPAGTDGSPVECRIETRLRFTLADSVAARLPGAPAPTDEGGQPAPLYPDQARIEGLEGYVEVSFEVTASGSVAGIEVTTAMPRGDFERAAQAALQKWRFPPGPGGSRTLSRRFEFTLPGAYPHAPSPTLLGAAPMPAEACAKRISGRVMLEVQTDADGRITEARVLQATPPGLFDQTALAVARNSRMAPAYRGGFPIAATALLTLKFRPDEAQCGGEDERDMPGPSRGSPSPRVSSTRWR